MSKAFARRNPPAGLLKRLLRRAIYRISYQLNACAARFRLIVPPTDLPAITALVERTGFRAPLTLSRATIAERRAFAKAP
jgi:hypothetical protein